MFCVGGIIQLLAGMYEFDRNNMFAATALTSYGGFWVSVCKMTSFRQNIFKLHNTQVCKEVTVDANAPPPVASSYCCKDCWLAIAFLST